MIGKPGVNKSGADAARQARMYGLGVAVIAVLALAVRMYRAGDPLGGYHSFNEGWYSYVASSYHSLRSLLFPTTPYGNIDYNVSPMLSYLLYAVKQFAGRSEFWFRMVPIAFSVGTIPLIYALGARWFGRFAGLSAAAFYAFAPVSVLIGRNIQTDAVYVFFMYASLLVYLGASDAGRAGRGRMFAAGLLFGIAFMTKQFAALLLPAMLLWEIGRRRGLKWFGVGHLLFGAGALVVPGPFFAYHLLNNLSKMAEAQHTLSASQFEAPTRGILYYLGTEYFWGLSPFLIIPAAVAVIYFLVKRNEGASLMMLSAAVFALFFSFWHGHSYYILFLTPACCLLAGGVIGALRAQAAAWVCVTALSVALCLHSFTFLCAVKYGFDEYQTLSRLVAVAPGSVIVPMDSLSGSYYPVLRYYNPNVGIVPEGDLHKTGQKDVSFPPGRTAWLVGFAGEDNDRLPKKKFFVLRKAYAVVLFGRAVMVQPVSEHFFMIEKVVTKKVGGPGEFGIKLLGKEPSLIFSVLSGGEKIPLPDGWIDFRPRKGKNK